MKKFSIEVISNKPKKIDSLLSHTGQITIGDYKETFVMPMNVWNLEEYKQQWQEGLERIKTHDSSCLVATVESLGAHPWIEVWVLYKEGNRIFIRNNLLTNEIVKDRPIKLSEFNAKNCYQFANYPRTTISEDSFEPSEWSVDINEI